MAASRRWFHPNISGQQAERLLMEKGQDWSFLARPSSTEGAYTLSIRRNGEVTHIKIQNTGDSFDLYGGETFATLAELIQYYMDNQEQLKEKNGAVIKLKYPMASVDPTPERWFHGHLTGREAERLLLDKGKNSSFLVRESQSKPGDFVISVKCEERVTHVKIRCQNGKYDVGGGEMFPSLSELVEHYKKSPMVETSGTVVYIKHPLYNSRVVASSLDKRIKQLQSEDDESQKSNTTFHEGFWGEFHQLQQCEFIGMKYSREKGSKPENKAKNRYKNILPYDYTRVVLSDGNEDLGTDYINANYISWTEDDQMIDSKRKYIATQGPLTSTMLDFYRMIWQEGSRVIVNLARITERGKIQINIYWPVAEEKNEKLFVFESPPDAYGKRDFICQYRVKLLNEAGDQTYIRREMLLSKEDRDGKMMEEPRQLFQFHYTSWPDYNVPDDPGSMIDLLERINNQLDSLPSPGPMVVHCSAGIGRTGTLIVTDMIINQIKAYGFDCDIDIFKTILNVRYQRSGLVQTQSQYQFVYLAVQRYMEIERQRQLAGQNIAGREYTNIKYATGVVEAAKRAQAAGGVPPPVPPLPSQGARRREVRPPQEDPSMQYQNINAMELS
ncbi:tyrosine-protein phosphatase non-receptor type 11 [Aplysia californica]|uniref:Tyrosine-protein phosphatase non-receptor type 11 n=1 Tax=Aplysia californica TaxID=6500 RepID=A0ABM1A616_APLCA|nr:tyrosine-protein phosphatase non-receptor type 11 [Aplysia californica]